MTKYNETATEQRESKNSNEIENKTKRTFTCTADSKFANELKHFSWNSCGITDSGSVFKNNNKHDVIECTEIVSAKWERKIIVGKWDEKNRKKDKPTHTNELSLRRYIDE